MPRFSVLSLLTAVLLCVTALRAQPGGRNPHHVDASELGKRIDLTSTWLFSPIDDPANASPSLDDNGWPVVLSNRELGSYGFHDVRVGWYRLHVYLPAVTRDVVAAAGGMQGNYQVFANGIRIGGSSKLSYVRGRFQRVAINYHLPDAVLGQAKGAAGGEVVLALRFAVAQGGGGTQNPLRTARLYLESADAASRDASYEATHDVVNFIFTGSLALLVSLVALALYVAMRSHKEYLAAAVTLFFYASFEMLVVRNSLRTTDWRDDLALTLAIAFFYVSSLEFVRLVLLLPRSRFLLAAEVLIFLGVSSQSVMDFAPSTASYLSYAPFCSASSLDLMILALLLQAWRRRNTDVFVLLALLCGSLGDDLWAFCRFVFSRLNHPIYLPALPSIRIKTYTLTFHALDDLFFAVMLLLFLVLRTVRIARERAEAAAEIEAAQTMQRLLLARSSDPTPGFDVESVYLPASEVGGDFFLVSADRVDGSLTAILGDVSGKGLTAAMRVAMILGVLRREDSREPATILFRLNEALLSQGDVGFTTACCVHLWADGAYTVANAGQISPYVNGVEVETAPGLPLGVAGEQSYASFTGRLEGSEKMVLMSDGVVEAKSANGELYGFERLQGLTMRSAREIAETAKSFGQEDDITVLTLGCSAGLVGA